MTGDLTNHNAPYNKSAILSDKAVRRVSLLTSVDLYLKNKVCRHLSAIETTFHLLFVHVYLMLEINQKEELIGSQAALTEELQRSVMAH